VELSELIEGQEYRVSAVGTNEREVWTIIKITDNGEVQARGSKTAYVRTFRPGDFTELNLKTKYGKKKKMITESVEHVMQMQSDPSVDMWVENLIHFPKQERRGRRPNA